MGCCCGTNLEKKIPAEWMAQFFALKLTKSELLKFFRIFRKIDVDSTGTIEVEELLNFLDLEYTSFNRRAFSVFDSNGSGKVDFREFVLSVWNYCTLTKATLDIFAFDLYDADASGELSLMEVEKMVADLYGKKYHENAQARQVIQELKKIEKRTHLDAEKFFEFCRYHQAMLFPAFQLQLKLQEHIMGTSFWKKCTNRRVELSKGTYVTMGDLMEMHLHKELYAKLVTAGSFHVKKGKANPAPPGVLYNNTGTLHSRGGHEHPPSHAPPATGSTNPNHGHERRRSSDHGGSSDRHEHHSHDTSAHEHHEQHPERRHSHSHEPPRAMLDEGNHGEYFPPHRRSSKDEHGDGHHPRSSAKDEHGNRRGSHKVYIAEEEE